MYLTIRRYKKMLLDSDRYEAVINYGKDAGNLEMAFQIWDNLVKQKGVKYRYFEYDDPKYLEFYKSKK